MPALRKINLGAYAAGEIPPPLSHQYLGNDRLPLPITGWIVLGFFVEGDAPCGLGDLQITDGPNGIITYTWDPDDMQTPGNYRGLMWVQNDPDPTVRLASDLFLWTVVDGPGPTPPVS